MTPAVVHPSESQHWYTRDGQPAYTVIGENGQERPTTLRDARKLDLVPSVTTVIKCSAAPGLEIWKQDQMLYAALTLPRGIDEAEAEWLLRVKQDSQEQGRAAAERGTEIHAAIEAFYGGLERGLELPVGMPVPSPVREVHEAIGLAFGVDVEWHAETAFACELGFGGKADLLGYEYIDGPDELPSPAILLDVKTKDAWTAGKPPSVFDEHALQLAAYRYGLGAYEAACAIVFVSRSEPWQVSIATLDEDELQRGWRMFRALLDYWKAKSNFDPAWEQEECLAIPF